MKREHFHLKKIYHNKNEENYSTVDKNMINMVIQFQCMKL